MKKQLMNGEAPFDSVLPEYGKKKLLMYADSFRDLANTFADIQQQEKADVIAEGRNIFGKEDCWKTGI